MPTAKAQWYDDPYEVNKLLRYLAETEHDSMDLVYAHEKPWKFEDEYKLAIDSETGTEFDHPIGIAYPRPVDLENEADFDD